MSQKLTEQEILSKVQEIITEHSFASETVKPGDTLSSLDADSFDFIEITLALEDEFGIMLSETEEPTGQSTSQTIAYIVHNKLNQ